MNIGAENKKPGEELALAIYQLCEVAVTWFQEHPNATLDDDGIWRDHSQTTS